MRAKVIPEGAVAVPMLPVVLDGVDVVSAPPRLVLAEEEPAGQAVLAQVLVAEASIAAICAPGDLARRRPTEMSMTGFAARPGTAVEPMCSTRDDVGAERPPHQLCLGLVAARPLRVVVGDLERRLAQEPRRATSTSPALPRSTELGARRPPRSASG